MIKFQRNIDGKINQDTNNKTNNNNKTIDQRFPKMAITTTTLPVCLTIKKISDMITTNNECHNRIELAK